jgi:hypothetical protein
MSRIEELERLEREATRGPWRMNTTEMPHGYDNWTYSVQAPDGEEVLGDGGYDYEGYSVVASLLDASLIVALRNSAPAILTALRAAHAVCEAQAIADRETICLGKGSAEFPTYCERMHPLVRALKAALDALEVTP